MPVFRLNDAEVGIGDVDDRVSTYWYLNILAVIDFYRGNASIYKLYVIWTGN